MRPTRSRLVVGIVSLLLAAAWIFGDVPSYLAARRPAATATPTPLTRQDTLPQREPLESLPPGESPRPRSTAVPSPSLVPTPSAAPQLGVAASLIPASQGLVDDHPNAPAYRINAEFFPQDHQIRGTQTVVFTNTQSIAFTAIYFRLYVNAPLYNEGGIEVRNVRVDGDTTFTTLEVEDTALKVVLPRPLSPNQSAEITLDFQSTIPTSGGGYGIFNEQDGIFAMYNWHPELAVYENNDWLLHPITDQGDPTNTEAANYNVTLRAPTTHTIISSGTEAGRTTSGNTVTHTIVSALTRNFVLVASDQVTLSTTNVGAVRVSSYYFPEDAQAGRAALDAAARSIRLFSEQIGPYPYNEFDVAQVVLGGGAGGMEATGLIMIARDTYRAEPDDAAAAGEAIEGVAAAEGTGTFNATLMSFVVAHETAHQWWYSIVGSDAHRQPWLDEGVTNWASTWYFEQTADAEALQQARTSFTAGPYENALFVVGDQRLDQPADVFDDWGYGTIVYGKGAVMYDALRAELGDDTFFRFLRQYYRDYQFGRADGQDWLRTLNSVASIDMTPFYERWIESDQITIYDFPASQP